jgi:hypothetical protein
MDFPPKGVAALPPPVPPLPRSTARGDSPLPIRHRRLRIECVRVKTNVDLSRVRYHQVQYNRRDVEEAAPFRPEIG